MKRRLAILSLAGLAASGAASGHPTAEQTRAEFEAVCRSLRRDNAFFGEQVVEDQRRRLAGASYSTVERAQLLGGLAWELNRLGRQTEAITELERARELLAGLPDAAAPEVDHRLAFLAANVHLRLGEDLNCAGRHNARSCILPVDPAAVHQLPEHARAAARLYREYLDTEPDDLHARWLLNVATLVAGDEPATLPPELRLPAGALSSAVDFPQWREIGGELGIAAFDLAGGAVMDDFDGDGLLDVISSTMDPCGPLQAFRNDGRGGFEDVAAAWGLDGQLGGLNLMHADADGDGGLDLLVL
ncbi:MAG: FG-GAP-like repeat-containing protein, partial [Thermoanaerobaculia bacterium]